MIKKSEGTVKVLREFVWTKDFGGGRGDGPQSRKCDLTYLGGGGNSEQSQRKDACRENKKNVRFGEKYFSIGIKLILYLLFKQRTSKVPKTASGGTGSGSRASHKA